MDNEDIPLISSEMLDEIIRIDVERDMWWHEVWPKIWEIPEVPEGTTTWDVIQGKRIED